MIRRAWGAALRRFSTVLIGFGLLLVAIGLGVQAVRALRVQRAEEQSVAPSFQASIRSSDIGPSIESDAVPIGSDDASGSGDEGGVTTSDAAPDAASELATGQDSQSGIDVAGGPSTSGEAEFFVPWEGAIDARYMPIAVVRRPRFAHPTPTPTATPPPFAAAAPERIIIPSLKLDRRVVEIGWDQELVDNDTLRSVWQTARHAAGFHRGSAEVGEPGNTVISGHNNIDGAVFGELHLLETGDRVMLDAGGEMRTYEVEMNFIVEEEGMPLAQRQDNARWIGETPDERLTLVTCYPPWGNSHRTIIVARPVAGPGGDAAEERVR